MKKGLIITITALVTTSILVGFYLLNNKYEWIVEEKENNVVSEDTNTTLTKLGFQVYTEYDEVDGISYALYYNDEKVIEYSDRWGSGTAIQYNVIGDMLIVGNFYNEEKELFIIDKEGKLVESFANAKANGEAWIDDYNVDGNRINLSLRELDVDGTCEELMDESFDENFFISGEYYLEYSSETKTFGELQEVSTYTMGDLYNEYCK